MIAPPDDPRWVEANGMLASGEAWVRPAGAGNVVGHDAARLLVPIGDADPAAVASIARGRDGWAALVAPERGDLCAAFAGAGWDSEPAILHTLPDPATLADDEGAAPLPAEASLAQLPPALADEVDRARRTGTVWTVVVDGAAACFAHAPWRSRRWFDVSVETLPGYRQLGLGARVASAMIRAERAAGREPVWGATEGNAASRALAARLGFVAVDRLIVASAP